MIVPPTPVVFNTNAVKLVTSLTSLMVASNAAGVAGIFSAPLESTFCPPDEPSNDLAPNTTPTGSKHAAPIPHNAAASKRRRWREGIAVMTNSFSQQTHTSHAAL